MKSIWGKYDTVLTKIWWKIFQLFVVTKKINFSMKKLVGKPGKLCNFSTGILSHLNNNQKHFWSLFRSFELILMQSRVKINQNRRWLWTKMWIIINFKVYSDECLKGPMVFFNLQFRLQVKTKLLKLWLEMNHSTGGMCKIS